jgi:hypothetical protein
LAAGVAAQFAALPSLRIGGRDEQRNPVENLK